MSTHEFIVAAGGYPSPLNYHRFPKAICTSLNEVQCHGIPDDRPLQGGDILNIDVSCYVNGFHGDCSAMAAVGEVDEASQRLIEVTYKCLELGIAVCRPGTQFREIGRVVSQHAHQCGYTLAADFCGHGIGRAFHEEPIVMHIENNDTTVLRPIIVASGCAPLLTRCLSRQVMQPGMIFTVEPILCEGQPDYRIWDDNWTVVSKDGGRASQAEHTILITENGHEILTDTGAAGPQLGAAAPAGG